MEESNDNSWNLFFFITAACSSEEESQDEHQNHTEQRVMETFGKKQVVKSKNQSSLQRNQRICRPFT